MCGPGAVLVIFASACGIALYYSGVALSVSARSSLPRRCVVPTGSKSVLPTCSQPGRQSLLSNFFLQNGLGLLLLMAVSLVTFVVWKRTRFFGTAAPLLVGVLVFTFALRMHFSAFTFLFLALPFLLLFMAGVSADLLESRLRAGCQRGRLRGAHCQRHDRRLWTAQLNFSKPIGTLRHLTGWNKLKGHAGREPIRRGRAQQDCIAGFRVSSWLCRSLWRVPLDRTGAGRTALHQSGWRTFSGAASQCYLDWRTSHAAAASQRDLDPELQ